MSTSVVYVGLAVCSGSTTTLSNAVFSNVSITGGYPANLTATAGDSQVKLDWNPVSGAASYKVKRATTAGGPYTVIASPTTNSFTDTTAVNGTLASPNIYYYVVSAVRASLGESANSLQVSARPEAPLPDIPQNLSAVANGGQIALAWNPVAGAANYRVKRATSPLGPFGAIATISASSFTDLTAGTEANCFYVVTSLNVSEGESGNSNVASVVRGLYFDSNGAAAGSVVDGGAYSWLSNSWAVAAGGTEAVQGWQGGKEARFAATDPGGPLAYAVDLSGFDTGSHGNFTGIRNSSGVIQFTGNVSNFYLTTPVAITADPGSSITFSQTRSGADVLAINLNGQPAIFNGDITVNSAGIGNGGSITVNTSMLKLGNAIANFSPGSITIQQGATLLNDGAAGKYFNLSPLTLNGGTLAATNAADATRGNFVLTGGLTTGGTTTSVISADVRSNGGSDQTLNVGDTPEAIDLLLSGKFGHLNNVAWSYATKTGPGTMKLTGEQQLGRLTVSNGKLILEDTAADWSSTQYGLTNNSRLEFSVTTGSRSFGIPLGGSGSIAKSGPGSLTIDGVSSHSGGTTVNGGKLVLPGNGGQGRISGNLTVNAGGTVETTGDGSGLGYSNQISSVALNGGALTSSGTNHIWNIPGGITMTGGLLQSNNGTSNPTGPQLEWNRTSLTTLASAETATIAGRIRMRNDSSFSGITFTVADGTAATDLLVSAAITGASAGMGITKTGPGTMTLTGTNSYTGQTSVNEGTLQINGSLAGTVTVGGNGTLAPGDNGTGTLTVASAAISGKLAMELDGASADRLNVTGNLNITNATLAFTGTPTVPDVVIASFGSLTGSAFAQVTGLPSGYQVTYDLTNKQIKLTTVSTGFAAWIGLYTVSDPLPQGDPDLDGIANLLEYVLGGNPSLSSTGILPAADLTNDNLVFTFHRRTFSAGDTTQIFQYGSNLTGWTDLLVIHGEFISISNNLPEPGMDEVVITIPAPGLPKMFGRLKVIKP